MAIRTKATAKVTHHWLNGRDKRGGVRDRALVSGQNEATTDVLHMYVPSMGQKIEDGGSCRVLIYWLGKETTSVSSWMRDRMRGKG